MPSDEDKNTERVWVDCKHGRWLSPCPICAEEKRIAEQGWTQFKREHFSRIDMDEYHYYYSFGVPGFEICLEPCAEGFDVAIYTDNDGIPQYEKSAIEPKRCTETGDYTQIDALFGDRKDEDWNKALAIADELLDKYIEDRQKLAELLARKQKEKVCACYTEGKSLCGDKYSMNTIIHSNVTCEKCLAILKQTSGNDLILPEEIKALRACAKTITMKEGLRLTMQQGFVPIIPRPLISGFGVSMMIIDASEKNPIELVSVTYKGKKPDPADADHIALAVLGKGYTPILMSKGMMHYFKRRDVR